mgnify:FL=1
MSAQPVAAAIEGNSALKGGADGGLQFDTGAIDTWQAQPVANSRPEPAVAHHTGNRVVEMGQRTG